MEKLNDLVFNFTDCMNINIETPNELDDLDLIVEMQESPQLNSTHIQKYTVEISKNCCPDIIIKAPVFYNFTHAATTCTPGSNYVYGFNLLGINPLFVNSLRIRKDNELNFQTALFGSVSGNTGITYTVSYPFAEVAIANAVFGNPRNTEDYTFYLEINHIDGFVYIVEVTFRLEQPGNCNMISSSIVDIIYPEIDDRIEFDTPTTINLLPLFSYDTTALSGIYRVIICRQYLSNPLTIMSQSTNCVQNVYFVDCYLKCKVVNKVINCKDTNVNMLYDGLTWSNDPLCYSSYEALCDTYEIMMNKLENPDCRDPFDDCNCGESKDEYFKQRGYNNNKTMARGCSGCKK